MNANNRWKSFGSVAILLSCVVGFALGCGSGSPFDYVPVSGKVTYEDGTPIPASSIHLTFISAAPPVNEKMHPRPAKAKGVNIADGTFDVVTSYKYGDGLIPGKHKVLVKAYDADGKLSSAVPSEYVHPNTTPLVIDTADTPFHLKVKRP